jgi:hypothetical protein
VTDVMPRLPFRSIVEWVAAAAVSMAMVLVVAVLVRDARTFQAAVPLDASAPTPPAVPAGVPPRAVSVPLLFLPEGITLRVGDPAAEVELRLRGKADLTAEAWDRMEGRERVIRSYTLAGTRFVLVVEGDDDSPRVMAIYLP